MVISECQTNMADVAMHVRDRAYSAKIAISHIAHDFRPGRVEVELPHHASSIRHCLQSERTWPEKSLQPSTLPILNIHYFAQHIT